MPRRRLPDFAVRIAAWFDPIVRGQLYELGKVRRASSAKATRVLGWTQRPVADTIVDTAHSLFAVGTVTR